MAQTFTLTGTLLRFDKTPVNGAQIQIASLPGRAVDAAADEIYSQVLTVRTDSNGEFSVTLVTLPDLYYSIGPIWPQDIFTPMTFAAPAAGFTLDLSDVSPVDPAPTFSAVFVGPQGIQGVQGPQGIQGTQGVQGVQGIPGVQIVNHGTDANVARPAGPVMYWKGTVRPNNALATDWWLNA